MSTPTNGGFHGAAPSRNLSFGYGQRPVIHRLQHCRAHKPPDFGHRNGTTTGLQHGSWGPGGAPLRRVGPPSDEECAKRNDLQHRRRDQPGMEDVERGLLLVSTHTHRPLLGNRNPCNSKRCQFCILGTFIVRRWPVPPIFPIQSGPLLENEL